MTKPKLLYYSMLQYQPDNYHFLQQEFDLLELKDPSEDTDEILEQVDVILAPLGYFIGKDKMDKCPRLKVIGSNTTGHPHIDVDYAKSRRVAVATLKYEQDFLDSITPTAELTWGVLISLTRNVLSANQYVQNGNWNRRPFGGGKMLSRMKIGIVGLGRLGKRVSQYALSFGMDVIYYDPFVSSGQPGLEKVMSLTELVSRVDIVTVHVPHEKSTANMFDEAVFKAFKDGSFFVNTARGELVDHKELLKALESGKIAGAALDVFENEFDPCFEETISSHSLWQYAQENSNVILTPHIGGSTYDAWYETERHTIKLIQNALSDTGENENLNIEKDSVWAFIPARGGSKSIPLKNMTQLDGKPLIDYAIKVGKATKVISRIICSSDSDVILDFCEDQEIDVHRRPEGLSLDNISTVDVLVYVLKEIHSVEKQLPEFLVLLEPTSPFVEPEHIINCINAIKDNDKADSSQTVTKVSSNSHAYNQRFHDENGSHFLFEHERKTCINKQLKPVFFIHGNVRIMRVASLLKNGSIFGKISIPIEIPRINAMDVDGPDDLALADSMIKTGLIQVLKES